MTGPPQGGRATKAQAADSAAPASVGQMRRGTEARSDSGSGGAGGTRATRVVGQGPGRHATQLDGGTASAAPA